MDTIDTARIEILQAVTSLMNFSDMHRARLISTGEIFNINRSKTQLVAITPQLFYAHMGVLSGPNFKKVQRKCKERGYSLRWVKEHETLYISLNLDAWNESIAVGSK